MNGNILRTKSGGIRVTVYAPKNARMNAAMAAGAAVLHCSRTRREKLIAAAPVPHTPANLLVPSSVAGTTLVKVENNAGV